MLKPHGRLQLSMIDLMAGYKNVFFTLNTRGGLFSTLKTRGGLFYTYFFCYCYVNPLNMGFYLNLNWGPLHMYATFLPYDRYLFTRCTECDSRNCKPCVLFLLRLCHYGSGLVLATRSWLIYCSDLFGFVYLLFEPPKGGREFSFAPGLISCKSNFWPATRER